MGFATWWRPYATRRSRRRTRFRGASQGRTGCATPPTTLTLPPRMTTSAATWRRPTATWKICEMEMKTRPKKAKKYSYTKDCKEQPREICDQCEKKTIEPQCDMQERLTCIYK